jgi:hypothetical protein
MPLKRSRTQVITRLPIVAIQYAAILGWRCQMQVFSGGESEEPDAEAEDLQGPHHLRSSAKFEMR